MYPILQWLLLLCGGVAFIVIVYLALRVLMTIFIYSLFGPLA